MIPTERQVQQCTLLLPILSVKTPLSSDTCVLSPTTTQVAITSHLALCKIRIILCTVSWKKADNQNENIEFLKSRMRNLLTAQGKTKARLGWKTSLINLETPWVRDIWFRSCVKQWRSRIIICPIYDKQQWLSCWQWQTKMRIILTMPSNNHYTIWSQPCGLTSQLHLPLPHSQPQVQPVLRGSL